MRRSILVGMMLLGACAAPRVLPVAPSEAERGAAAMSPRMLASSESIAACETAKAELRTEIAAEPLVRAMLLQDRLQSQCNGNDDSAWARGWAARERGDADAAARAFLDELDGDEPVAWTGAALLELLPQLSRPMRRRIWQIGRNPSKPYAGGWQDVARDRLASLRCGGRSFRYAQISCGRGYCEYRVICDGGARRNLAFASRALVF
jgi:hypothetical protein